MATFAPPQPKEATPKPKPRAAKKSPLATRQLSRADAALPSFYRSFPLQAKLTVSQPGDLHEREADRVADQIMRAPASSGAAGPALTSSTGTVQRACAACAEEGTIARKADGSSAAPALATGPTGGRGSRVERSVREGLEGGGRPLEASTRKFMESHFGTSFDGVLVHTGARATASAKAIHAHAYTVGGNIVFAEGKYAPESTAGKRLLAHELAHVVQQRAAMHTGELEIQRQTATPDPEKESRCKDLFGLIREAVAVLIQRAADLLNDPLGLQWDNWTTPKILPGGQNVGSVQGHQQQYENWRTRLQNLIREWDDDDCNSTGRRITVEERQLQFNPTPAPIPRPRPDANPKPFEAPGAHRIGAAAKGAAIGATAGLVLGGIAGAIGGGAGGTLVAPGVGTVGGGVAGAVAGAEAGAPIGAAIGTAIGGVIGFFTDED